MRPKLNGRRFRAENANWWQGADLAGVGAYWGGEVAADRLTRHLQPATCTIYVKPQQTKAALTALATTHRLRADPDGNIEVLDAFWNFPPDPAEPDLVPTVLVYADLVRTLEPRNLEVATMLRAAIEDALRQV